MKFSEVKFHTTWKSWKLFKYLIIRGKEKEDREKNGEEKDKNNGKNWKKIFLCKMLRKIYEINNDKHLN